MWLTAEVFGLFAFPHSPGPGSLVGRLGVGRGNGLDRDSSRASFFVQQTGNGGASGSTSGVPAAVTTEEKQGPRGSRNVQTQPRNERRGGGSRQRRREKNRKARNRIVCSDGTGAKTFLAYPSQPEALPPCAKPLMPSLLTVAPPHPPLKRRPSEQTERERRPARAATKPEKKKS